MTLSVIIPTYNEEDHIADTINAVHEHATESVLEVIVVDANSTDATQPVAEAAGARMVICEQKGRAAQMNYGAERAKGDILYFLHADTKPPEQFARQIQNAVSQGIISGCFRLAFDSNHILLDFYAWCTRFDIDAFRFGDQSLFITRNAFFSIGGFCEGHIVMEDNEIVRRIKKEFSFTILDDSVVTSARSYQNVGIIKLQLVFVFIYVLYFAGVSQQNLARIRKAVIGD
jgi:rSAM/selenodomain-associated transferase 2